MVSSRYGMSFVVSGDRLFSSNRLGKSFIKMLNKVVQSTSPYFRPIVVRKVWLILSWCIRDTFGDLYIDLIISRIFPINPISSNQYNRRFRHIESQAFQKYTNKVYKYFPLLIAFLIKLKSLNIWPIVL